MKSTATNFLIVLLTTLTVARTCCALVVGGVHVHIVPISRGNSCLDTSADTPSSSSSSRLYAKPKNKKSKAAKNNKPSTSGFGGAATEPCPCGNNNAYMKCCGKIHKDADAYAKATCEQVVRARYSAYAKREIEFIIGSTHPLNKVFEADIEHWKEQIEINCYDNFVLNSCEILSEIYDDGEGDKQEGKVQFVASMTQRDSKEKTSFMETSTFARGGKHIRNGAWLYREGVIAPAPGQETYREEVKEVDQEVLDSGTE